MHEQTEEKKPLRVTREMMIGEVVQQYPKTAFVMLQYGLHCVGCHVSAYETIEQGTLGHGMSEEELTELLEDLNAFIEDEEKELAKMNAERAKKE